MQFAVGGNGSGAEVPVLVRVKESPVELLGRHFYGKVTGRHVFLDRRPDPGALVIDEKVQEGDNDGKGQDPLDLRLVARLVTGLGAVLAAVTDHQVNEVAFQADEEGARDEVNEMEKRVDVDGEGGNSRGKGVKHAGFLSICARGW